MSAEEWRAVSGWVGWYEVSSHGRVRSVDRVSAGPKPRRLKGRILRPGVTPDGYLNVTFSGNGRRHTLKIHRIVAETFIGPKPAGLETCHSDGDKLNNSVANLRYATKSENELDKRRHGTQHRGAWTHCMRGHEFTSDNTYVSARGTRSCRECARQYHRDRRARKLTAPAA